MPNRRMDIQVYQLVPDFQTVRIKKARRSRGIDELSILSTGCHLKIGNPVSFRA